MDPWALELIVVQHGSHDGAERRALSRDVDRGLLARIRQGVYTAASPLADLAPEPMHVVRLRALAAVAAEPPVFSLWSAALLLGLPSYRAGLQKLHVTAPDPRWHGLQDVSDHVFPLADDEIVEVRGLSSTSVPRTVFDIAAARPRGEGVAVADGALHAGVRREALEAAVLRGASRRGAKRAGDVVAFAHPGAENANESESRVTMFRMGLEPQELQWEIWDEQGFVAAVDTYSKRCRVAGEADGAMKILDPRFATKGAAQAVYREKLREDRARRQLAGLARWGWRESRSVPLLRPILAAAGMRPPDRRPTLADWAAAARNGRARRRWRPET